MSVLSNIDILENINIGVLKIQGMSKDTIRENGLDLTISEIYSKESDFIEGENIPFSSVVDLHNQSQKRFTKHKAKDGKIIILPNEFLLLSTQEYIEVPSDIMGFCAIRSTIARSGIMCPSTIIDAGFHGTITIELCNVSKRPILFHTGDRFLHVILNYTKSPSSTPYCGLYQNQKEVKEPKRSVE